MFEEFLSETRRDCIENLRIDGLIILKVISVLVGWEVVDWINLAQDGYK